VTELAGEIARLWLLFIDIGAELWERFRALEQGWQPVVVIGLLLCFALIVFLLNLWSADFTIEDIDMPAPTALPVSQRLSLSPKSWFLHYVQILYIRRCKPKRIGWFAPWIFIWINSIGVAGCALFAVLELIGISAALRPLLVAAFAITLFLAAVVGFIHNAGRLHALRKSQVSALTFAKVFGVPYLLAVSLIAALLYRPGLVWLWRAARNSGIVG
jgi:hypothetical protein